jgi:hypothetical protein
MTFDVTTNRIPFGLLTQEEQATLKAWPHDWEYWNCFGAFWDVCNPTWCSSGIYRGKPAPKVTSYWFNLYDGDRIGQIYTVQDAAASELKRVRRSDNSVTMRIQICNGEVTVTKET